VIRDNEAFLAETPAVDGGAFDIDWGCENNRIEYNYGHDNAGYCVAVFGARNRVTTASTVKYNVCVNNARSARMAKRQGDVFLATWDGGSLDGIEVHNNTFVWNPPVDAPLFHIMDAYGVGTVELAGSRPRRIHHNLVASTVPTVEDIRGRIETADNRIWRRGQPDQPMLDPLLRPLQRSDAGAAAPERAVPGALPPATSPVPAREAGAKLLGVYVDPSQPGARRLVLLIRSAAHQFGPLGLGIRIELPRTAPRNLPHDWHFADLPHSYSDTPPPAVMSLTGANGTSLMTWREQPSPAELGLALRWFIGDPYGSPPIDFAFAADDAVRQARR
jgi:hypothetical protein